MPKHVPIISAILITEVILIFVFKHSKVYKKIAALALIVLSSGLAVFIRNCIEEDAPIEMSLLKSLCKYKIVVLLIVFYHTFYSKQRTFMISFFSLTFMFVDLSRVFFYEYIKKNFEKKLIGGVFNEILELEKFLIGKGSDYVPNFINFKRKGFPKPLDLDSLFLSWNGAKTMDTECEIITVENTPEIANLEFRDHNSTGYDNSVEEREEHIGENDIIISDLDADVEDVIDIDTNNNDEHIDNRNNDLIDIGNNDLIDSRNNDLIDNGNNIGTGFINGSTPYNTTYTPFNTNTPYLYDTLLQKPYFDDPKSRDITIYTLRTQFTEAESKLIFSIISFMRNSSLNYDLFIENMKQIENERINLYNAITDFYSLMYKVKYTGVAIQIIFCIAIFLFYHESSTFITALCVPFGLFVLRPSFRACFDGMFFILASNPYNTSDRIYLQNENLLVRKITFLSTKFDKWSGESVVVSNQIIKECGVLNVMRSRSQQWKLELMISIHTSLEKIKNLKGELKHFVQNEMAFVNVNIVHSEIILCKFIKLNIFVKHRRNYQNGFFTWVNHTVFMKKLNQILKDLEIEYVPLNYNIELIV